MPFSNKKGRKDINKIAFKIFANNIYIKSIYLSKSLVIPSPHPESFKLQSLMAKVFLRAYHFGDYLNSSPALAN